MAVAWLIPLRRTGDGARFRSTPLQRGKKSVAITSNSRKRQLVERITAGCACHRRVGALGIAELLAATRAREDAPQLSMSVRRDGRKCDRPHRNGSGGLLVWWFEMTRQTSEGELAYKRLLVRRSRACTRVESGGLAGRAARREMQER